MKKQVFIQKLESDAYPEGRSYLHSILLGRGKSRPLFWTLLQERALFFETEDEAQATIDFISNVIDFETAECLEIVIVP